MEAAGTTFSMDQRFSDYVVTWMSTDAFFQTRQAFDGATNGNSQVNLHDASQPPLRLRPHIIVSEQVDQSMNFAQRRATWEMTRRNGRSRVSTLTTDTWRDSAGKLWQPNALVSVDVPLLKVSTQRWVIGEVTYRLDESGTHADLTLMPPEAYQLEPFNLQPVPWQVYQELQRGGASRDLPSADNGYDPTIQGRGDL
ncbi:phage baseplate assembly protein [Acidisphaera sp. L21]|uniref:phage baseplate assembly protein n=1 Tax=Acidisphaera sp. L21 TaxID=1641851 RepID=UPI00131E17F9|nr:hypothetical protein [Acidisphaera sp. L21]